jgi:gamma-glutamyltranspeptidase/glutathione hydrolase
MQRIAEEGADIVYEGAIAAAIAEEVQSHGGFLTIEDLADFEVEWPEPVSTTYNGATVYELPPNNQGLVALEALNIAAELGAGEYDYDTAERVHYFSEATSPTPSTKTTRRSRRRRGPRVGRRPSGRPRTTT